MRPFDPRVLRLVPAARGPLLALLVLGIGAGLAAIAQAFAIAGVVLAIAQPGDRDLMTALVWAAVAFGTRGALLAATEAVAAHAGGVVSGGLRGALAAELMRRRAEDSPDELTATTLLNQGAASVEPYVARYLPTLVAAAFLPVAVIVAMAVVDLPTAVIPVLTVPLLPLFAALIGSTTADATNKRWRTLAALSGHFLDVMRGLPVLVSYGRAHRQAGVVREVSEQHRDATVRTLRLAFLSSAALELFATISVAIVAVWVGIHLAAGNMALAVALPLILLAPEAYWPIRRVGAEFHSAADGAQALAQIADELERPILAHAGFSDVEAADVEAADVEAAGGADPIAGRLAGSADPIAGRLAGGADPIAGRLAGGADRPADPTAVHPEPIASANPDESGAAGARVGADPRQTFVHDLAYRYDPQLPWVLTDLTADLGTADGTGLVALTGPSGAGKTTLLELLAGLRTPTSGAVRVPGRTHLVTQTPFLLAGSLRDNLQVRAAADAADEDLERALQRVGLGYLLGPADAAQGRPLPRGLDTLLGDDGFGLSAGQRARLALAGALLAEPTVLLLDEPTAHLDPDAEALVHDVLRDLARSRLVVAVSHRQRLISLADQRVDIPVAASCGVAR